MYHRRKVNRYDSYLLCTFQDLSYHQILNYQELALRNMIISKQPRRHFESAIMKIPLIELQLNIIYN